MKIEKYELTKKNIYNVYLSNGEALELNGKVITDNELLIKKDIDNELSVITLPFNSNTSPLDK